MRYLVFLLVVCVFLFSSGCGDEEIVNGELPVEEPVEEPEEEPEEESEEVSVSISGFAFNPATITISVGTEVTWTNEDAEIHTVTSAGNFDSGSMAQGDMFSHTFDQPGTFDYICTPHPYMEGQVIVE